MEKNRIVANNFHRNINSRKRAKNDYMSVAAADQVELDDRNVAVKRTISSYSIPHNCVSTCQQSNRALGILHYYLVQNMDHEVIS